MITVFALCALVSVLVLVGQWISMRAVGLVGIEGFPVRLQPRLRWWAANGRWVGAPCVLVLGLAAASDLVLAIA